MGFSKADHVTDEYAAALIKVPAGELDRLRLKRHQVGSHIVRNSELFDPIAGVLREMPGNFEVDMKWRDRRSLAQLSSMTAIRSSVMSRQRESFQRSSNHFMELFVAGIEFQHIDVEFALTAQAGHCKIAAADESDDGIEAVIPMGKVELRVQGMT